LRLFRCDGLLCAKVGEWCKADRQVRTVKAKLPGTKTLAGEMPRQALDRLIGKDLAAKNPQVDTGNIEVEVEEAPSESYGVATKYVRTIFTACVGPMGPASGPIDFFVEASDGEQSQRLEVFMARWPEEMPDGGSVYAWIPSQDFERLGKLESLSLSLGLTASMNLLTNEVMQI